MQNDAKEVTTGQGTRRGNKPRRERLSIDLEAHADVKAMLARAERVRPGVSRTYITITALRLFLKDCGANGKAVAALQKVEPGPETVFRVP